MSSDKKDFISLDVFDQNLAKVKNLDIYSGFLKGKLYFSLVTDCVKAYRASQRQGNASSKTKGQVTGSGAKPWKQKGSGRARSASRKNPIWKGGGVTFGPKPRDYSLSINKKMKKKALLSVLRSRFLEKQLLIVEDWKIESAKTKDFYNILRKFKLADKTLFVNQDRKQNMLRATANLKKVFVKQSSLVNLLDVISCSKIVFTEKAILDLQHRLYSKELNVQ